MVLDGLENLTIERSTTKASASWFPGKSGWRKQKELFKLLCAPEGWPNAAKTGNTEGAALAKRLVLPLRPCSPVSTCTQEEPSGEKRGFQSLSWMLTDCQLVQRQPTGAETFPGPDCCRLVDPRHLVCNYRSVYTRQETENNTLSGSTSKPESRTKADSSNKCFH